MILSIERNRLAGTVDWKLQPRDALCLSLRYQHGATLQEAGEILDVSGPRVRELECFILRKMSVSQVRALALMVPGNMQAKLLKRAAEFAPIKWRHEPEGDPDWRKP